MEDKRDTALGNRISVLMFVNGLNNSELAHRVGVTGSAIGNIVNGSTKKASAELVTKIAHALDVSSDWLMKGNEKSSINTGSGLLNAMLEYLEYQGQSLNPELKKAGATEQKMRDTEEAEKNEIKQILYGASEAIEQIKKRLGLS